MKRAIIRFYFYLLFFLMVFLFVGETSFAAEETAGNWRPLYDLCMRWINFGILVFIFFKYARKPLINFLMGRRKELSKEINEAEREKEKIITQVEENQKTLDSSGDRFAALKEKIIKQGKKEKEKIIKTAQQESKIMMTDAKRKVENQIRQAKKTFRAELIDTSIALAAEKLPDVMTEEDNEKFIQQYLEHATLK